MLCMYVSVLYETFVVSLGIYFFLNCSQIPQVLEAIVKLIQQEGSVSTVCDMSDEHVGVLQQ